MLGVRSVGDEGVREVSRKDALVTKVAEAARSHASYVMSHTRVLMIVSRVLMSRRGYW